MQREAPLDLVQAVWEHPLGFKAVGFKLNLGQSPIVFDEVLSNPAIRKIVVSRKNRLRTFVSEKIASTTGVWESYVNSEREKLSISVNVTLDELESHVARNRDYYQDIRLRLRNSGQTAMEIDYETLGDYKLWSRILRYLKVDPEVVLKGSTARMNDVALNRIISNYDELSRELSGHELEQDIS
jgi:LPS sulfotransferase NodH